jgi:hypothetical protein
MKPANTLSHSKKRDSTMPGSAPFRLNRSGVLLALISAGFAGGASAAAARVDFTTAGVTVAGRDGQARPLARGVELDTGDTVRTSSEGRAQLRFSDGSYVSLQPNTDFAINDYKFEGKNDDRGFFGLVRGAMRTVTGAVGRVNRNSYRITTPTATVGIRGTGGVIQVQNDGSTLVIGTSGIWSLTNPAGSIDIPAGVSGLAPTEPNTPPKETTTQPQTGPTPVQPQQTQFVQGEQVNPDGTAVVSAIVPLVTGPGYASAVAFSWFSNSQVFSNGDAFGTFDASGRLMEVSFSDGQNFKMNGTHAEFGTDGILAWGRWIGNVAGKANIDGLLDVDETYDATQGLHYVIGTPTAVMPTTGTATYSLAGATSPTYVGGGSAPGTLLPSSGLTVTFGATHSIGTNLDIAMSDGKGYKVTGATTSRTSLFSMNSQQVIVVGTSGGACGQGCAGTIQGFFAGANAIRAGVGYEVQDFTGSQVVGAAAFKKN